MGAAGLAWQATGGALDDVCTTPPVVQAVVPETSRRQRLRARPDQFTSLCRALLAPHA
ncbi:hypothetical protein [Hydrogenophaga sp.]|uniref:hypothetical protein n=1 Tax=Hydrogenophaga sp. TaxID=1904254 RepID=UPI00271A59D7|nr:hypothetical protein [Hydrogenophaga sp.]MDO9603995.1 hypothetical protein [Hydrogenophaga sp.]